MINILGTSPIQQEAIRKLLKHKTVTYKELVRAAFIEKGMDVPKVIPALSVLTYREGQTLIDYGNNL